MSNYASFINNWLVSTINISSIMIEALLYLTESSRKSFIHYESPTRKRYKKFV